VAQLVWKVFVGYMESCAVMLDADERNSCTFEDTATTDFDLETVFFRTLFLGPRHGALLIAILS
jgi:hypothetical protein